MNRTFRTGLVLGATAAAGLGLLSLPASAQGGWTVVDLAPDGDFSCAYDINDAGEIAGYLDGIATRWSADLVATPLGTLGGAGSSAEGINSSGDVTGYAETAGGDEHAFVWDASTGVMTDIHPPTADPDSDSVGTAINDAGQVAGEFRTGGQARAFLYDPVGPTWTNLGVIGGGASSWANGMNNAGFVTGVGRVASSDGHVFLWNPGTSTMSDLGTNGGDQAMGFDVNDSNQVVGWSDVVGGATYGFLYDGGFTSLLPLAGFEQSEAIGVNDNGDAAGSSIDTGPDSINTATLWRAGAGPEELPGLGGAESAAQALNDSLHVVGCADVPGDNGEHAVLWDPPEPPPSSTTTTAPSSTTTARPATTVTPRFTG